VKLDLVFEQIQDAGLKVNTVESFFGKDVVEYLGYWITRNGIQPLPKKVVALKHLAPLTTKQELRRFIGLITVTILVICVAKDCSFCLPLHHLKQSMHRMKQHEVHVEMPHPLLEIQQFQMYRY
jgi:hypothetical protein